MRPLCKACGNRTFAPAVAKDLCKACLRDWVENYRLQQIRKLQGK